MTQVERIRTLADEQQLSQREIAQRLNISRNTVKKYLDADDFSPSVPTTRPRPGAKVLGPDLMAVIDQWLDADQKAPRKQRHTAKRIFDRLVEEYGYAHSYNPVHRYVKAWKEQARTPSEGFSPRVAHKATMEVDFGQAEVIIAGKPVTAHLFIATFPYSNMRFGQLFYGETAECVVSGLMNIMEWIGGVPTEMVFDNATPVGRRVYEKITTSELFGRFKLHYRTKARFCNPYSGHEKGNVENAVGFLRRNLLVPVPHGSNLKELNEDFFTRSINCADAIHYRKKQPIKDLFEEEKAHLLTLPVKPFHAVTYRHCKADKTGVITVDNNRYLVGSSFYRRMLLVEVSADTVTVFDEGKAHPIVSLPRHFGTHPELIFTPVTLLPLLKVKPGAWAQSPLRDYVPDPLSQWIDKASSQQRTQLFKALDKTCHNTSFTSAVQAAQALLPEATSAIDAYALDMLARRIDQGNDIPESQANLSVYDLMTTRNTPRPQHGGDAA